MRVITQKIHKVQRILFHGIITQSAQRIAKFREGSCYKRRDRDVSGPRKTANGKRLERIWGRTIIIIKIHIDVVDEAKLIECSDEFLLLLGIL